MKCDTTCKGCGRELAAWKDDMWWSRFDGARCVSCGPAPINTEGMKVTKLVDAVAEGAMDSRKAYLRARGFVTNHQGEHGKRNRPPQHKRLKNNNVDRTS